MHWSNTQSNIALSSAEAELNATVKGLSELIGFSNLIRETLRVKPRLTLHTDASACKGMLLRHGAGKVKHLSVKQLWSQEVVRVFDVQIIRVPREANPSDMLTHSVTFPSAEKQLVGFNFLAVRCRGVPVENSGSKPAVSLVASSVWKMCVH